MEGGVEGGCGDAEVKEAQSVFTARAAAAAVDLQVLERDLGDQQLMGNWHGWYAWRMFLDYPRPFVGQDIQSRLRDRSELPGARTELDEGGVKRIMPSRR